jgi:hypothetical protein
MALVTNTVNVHAVGFDELDNTDSTLGLVAVVFDVVVIVLGMLVSKRMKDKYLRTYRTAEPCCRTSLPA